MILPYQRKEKGEELFFGRGSEYLTKNFLKYFLIHAKVLNSTCNILLVFFVTWYSAKHFFCITLYTLKLWDIYEAVWMT